MAKVRLLVKAHSSGCISTSWNDRPVYVHCWGGRGRTGTGVGCFLAGYGYTSGYKALDLIQRLRQNTEDRDRAAPRHQEQMDMVRAWSAGE